MSLEPERLKLKEALVHVLSRKLGMGAAHSYGHLLKCQLNLSVRNVLGMGTTCGENNERAQAQLIGYIAQLKYALPINWRKDMDAITSYLNAEKFWTLRAALKSRWDKALELLHTALVDADDEAAKLKILVHADCPDAEKAMRIWGECRTRMIQLQQVFAVSIVL